MSYFVEKLLNRELFSYQGEIRHRPRKQKIDAEEF
jgi:hypothetical protein